MVGDKKDALGHELLDYLAGKTTFELIEREDGKIELSGGAVIYFAPFESWSASEQEAIGYAHGRALDIGCGAGRHSVYLQELGFDVLGMDISPLAIEVCKRRGLKKTVVLPVSQISDRLGIFDTILMMGNNFGLMANSKRAKWLLRRFFRLTSASGRLIVASLDPYETDDPDHLAYHESNRRRGRMAGQVRIRVRYRTFKSDWFDYLLVSEDEMQDLLTGTGWQVVRFIKSDPPLYLAVIEKSQAGSGKVSGK